MNRKREQAEPREESTALNRAATPQSAEARQHLPLNAGEQCLESFLHYLPGFAWIKNLEGRYVYVNTALQNLNAPREEWLGKTDFELWSKEVADTYRQNDLLVIANRKALQTLEPYSLNGERHYVVVSKFPIMDDGGTVIMVGGACIDVTALECNAAKLREYEKVVEGLEEMITVVDRDYRYVLANHAYLASHEGFEDVVGRFVWEVVGRDVFDQVVKPKIDEAFAGNFVTYETPYEYRTLGSRDLSVSYLPIVGIPGVERVAVIIQDITKRKRADQAVRLAEQKYRDIFENAGEGIFQSTPEGSFVAANPAMAAMFGYDSPEDLIRSCPDITRQIYLDPAQRNAYIIELESNGVVRGFEAQAVRKDGSSIWMSINARAVRDANGEITYYEGTAQDISERKRAEMTGAAFAALARKLSGARTHVAAAEIIGQTAQKLFEWDACTFDLYESESDSVVSLLNIDTIGGQQVDVTPKGITRTPSARSRHVLNNGPQLILRLGVPAFDSDSTPFGDKNRPSASIMTVPIKHGDVPVGLFSIQSYRKQAYDHAALRDLVALAEHCGEAINRIRAEQSLRESEERYRELFENSKDAIYVHDLNGRYTSANQAAEELTGYRREEIIGRHYSNFIAPRYLKEAREKFCLKIDVPIETTYEAEVVCKNGTRKPVEVTSRMIYKDETVIGVQGTVRDITERKRAQDVLQTYSRRLLEAQEAERHKIARELHDEIGQILTAVRLNLDSIQQSCETDTCLPRIDESVRIVDEALDQVRELSLELRPSLLDDLGLLAALRWFTSRYTSRSGILAGVTCNTELNGVSHEVSTACFRIAQEALTNSARHSKATKATVTVDKRHGKLCLNIRDNGVGFDAKLLLNGMASSALGLRGMQERALAVDGYVEINSEIGKGTDVLLVVPLKKI